MRARASRALGILPRLLRGARVVRLPGGACAARGPAACGRAYLPRSIAIP